MKVGDLVQFARHLGVIIQANDDATLIRWFEDGSIEPGAVVIVLPEPPSSGGELQPLAVAALLVGTLYVCVLITTAYACVPIATTAASIIRRLEDS